ncbi:hypothetical protein, partial [Streptomyces sp. NPDC002265]|uniref:hypothetical protein n=1 Tax=Streptomyces sp. NPDC002265 TaxID=3154415 RepID=UPI00331E0531
MSQAAVRWAQDLQTAQDELEASWRERALNTEAALKTAPAEILAQREQIAELIGQARDLKSEWSEEDIARIITENGSLKRQVRELSTKSKSLTGKLSTARHNVRFADKRIADLKVQLTEQNHSTMGSDAGSGDRVNLSPPPTRPPAWPGRPPRGRPREPRP